MKSFPRRRFLQHGLAAAAVPALRLGRYRLFAGSRDEYSARTLDLVARTPVLDMLGLLTLDFAASSNWMLDPTKYPPEQWARWPESGIDVIHPAVGIGGPAPFRQVEQFLESWNGFLAAHPTRFRRIDTIADVERARSSDQLGVLLGVQNSEHFRTVDDVDHFFSLGQRVSQLTYNSRTRIGTGSTDAVDEGISEYGQTVVERMNRVGMAIDVSHCGDQTTLDAFEMSRKPVLITHSNVRSLVGGHPRCKTDEAIAKMAKSGGVMGITAVRMFVRAEEPTTIEHVLDHYDHVRDLVGAEHLGIGSDIDLDGYDDMPAEALKALKAGYTASYAFRDKIDVEGLDHPRRVYDLTEGLLRRGYSEGEVEGILGGNFLRVLAEIWPAAASSTGDDRRPSRDQGRSRREE